MKKFLRSSLRRKTPSPDRKESADSRTSGYEVKEKDLPKLHKAAWNGDLSKVKQLAKKGDVNQLDKANRTPLHLACAHGQFDVVQFLVLNKAKLNICDNGHHSPLMKAVQGDHVNCIKHLLEHNADANLVDVDGMTALHLAAHTGSGDAVALLLDFDAMVNATNTDGCTPLHLATLVASDDVVELLLQKGADVNATDKHQRTPLMYACQADQIGIVKLLLESKADTEIKDSKGWTAADHAVMSAHHGCSHLINEHSAAHRARPASRQGGMFRAPGTPAAPGAETANVGYALGSPAADYADDVLSQEEEFTNSHSPPADSWPDTSEADDTTFGAPSENKTGAGVNLAKFVPASDTESNKSAPSGKSKIPRAVSKESLTNAGKKHPSPVDVGDSKIPRLQKNTGGNSPVTTPRLEDVETPRSEAVQTPRSAGDTEAESIVDFSDGDDVLADLSAHSDSPVKASNAKQNVSADSPKNVRSKGMSDGQTPVNMADDKKSKKSAMAEELGFDDEEFDDEDESQVDMIQMMDDDEEKSPTTKRPNVSAMNNSFQNAVGKDTSSDKKHNQDKVENDISEIDWDSDEDLLPSQSSNKKGDSAASTPRAVPIERLSPRALPLSNATPKVATAQPIQGKTLIDTMGSFDSEEEETESDWEKERKAKKEQEKLEQQRKDEEEKERQRMLQWDKEELDRKEREQREAKEALEKEKRDADEREQKFLEEEKKRREDEERRRQEEERKKEMERKREEEKRRQEEERRRAEERRKEDERRRAEQQRLDEERRRRDEEDRRRRAEEDRQNAERRRKMEEEKREAEKRRQEEQKAMEEQRREAQRKLDEERRKLEEDMKERERKRDIEKKKLGEEHMKNFEDKVGFNDGVSDFDDSESDWSNQPSPIVNRASIGLGRADSFEKNPTYRSSLSPRQPYTPGSANPSWKQVVAEEVDGLSFSDTDTEGDNMHSFVSSTPLPPPLTSSQHAQVAEPTAMIQLQENIRDHKRLIDKERTARITMETKVKKLEMDKTDLQRKIDRLSQTKSSLEQEKMELEANVRNLNYKLTEETEKANSAEALLEKTKEQLERKEQQYMQELEARQKVELSTRTLQMELRNSLNTIKQLEEDKEEMRKELVHTRSAKDVQEQLNQDHFKVQEALQQAEIFSRLESADDNRKFAVDQNDRLKAELYGLKMELERARSRYKDDQGMLAVENDDLNHRIDELKGEIRLNEEALAHATMTYNAHLGAAKTENAMLVSNLEKEKNSKEKLQAEVQSLTNRLTSTSHDLEKTLQAKTDLERTSHHERDDLRRTIERLEQELHHTRDGVQSKAQNLGATESRLKSVEHELHMANLQLTERNGQLASVQRELDQRKSMLDSSDKELMKERETRIKMEAKLEAASERLSTTQTEMSQVKYENTDVQGKLDNLLTSLRSDHDKSEAVLSEKNRGLTDTLDRLNQELKRAEDKHDKQEQHISQLQQELADVIKKLSSAEARLESVDKECTQLYKEKEAHANLHEKLFGSEKDRMTLEHKISALVDKLEQSEKSLQDTKQELANAQERMEQAKELEDKHHQLEIQKAKLESVVEHDGKKLERLEKELEDSQKVRTSLEALLGNLKSANIHLEDRLSEETAAKSLYAREADDHKTLWDSEVKSRSKLGLRIAQLERNKGEVAEQVNEEKKKTRKMAELKRQAEAKLDSEILKNQQLQKEVGMMKGALKSAKRKLRDLENPDMLVKSLQSNYDKERRTLNDTINGVRRQNEELAHQLQVENDMRASLEASNRQLQQELSSLQTVKKDKERLEKGYRKLQDHLGKIKANLGTGFVEKAEMDRFKQDMEVKARQEVNQKLEEVNAYLEEQAQARERLDDIRSKNEVQMKQDYETQINEMRAEVARMKAGHQESLVQKETAEAEAQRYKELYEKELKMRDKMREELEKATDKLSDAKAQLSLERQRSRHIRENGLDLSNGFMTPHIGQGSVDPMTQKVRNELDKSIARHLGSMDISPSIDTRENVPNNWGSPDGPNVSALDKANSKYLSVLKKNYFV
ncbi:ankyrin repeat domain-containing protein 26-like isoform X2 [Ptychodera flava]|uniref:ankyrin repeat domain-containing protein 26-like isoform X2 n=1 Tax=Ptychodera flava TaxID=63121 RepID=UPI003969D850